VFLPISDAKTILDPKIFPKNRFSTVRRVVNSIINQKKRPKKGPKQLKCSENCQKSIEVAFIGQPSLSLVDAKSKYQVPNTSKEWKFFVTVYKRS